MKKILLLNLLLLVVLAQSMLITGAITNETQSIAVANSTNKATLDTTARSTLVSMNTPAATLVTGNSTTSWQELGPKPLANTNNVFSWGSGPFSGRVTAIAVNGSNPQEIYIGTAQGGVWKTLNGGSSWTPLMDNMNSLAVGSLAISPDNSTLYVGTGEANWCGDCYAGMGLLKSTNEGQTWTVLGANYFDGSSISSIAIRPSNPNDILVTNTFGLYAKGFGFNATPSFGIYLSTDGGTTWSEPLVNNSYYGAAQLLVNSSSDNIIYASDYYGTIWKSIDGGSNWNPYWTNTTDPGRIALAMTPANPNKLYAIFASYGTGEITAIGTFDGTTHNYFNSSLPVNSNQYGPCNGQCWYNLLINVDPTNGNTIYVGTNSLYKSTNGGTSWSFLGGADGNGNLHPDMHAFAFAPDNPGTIYSGNDGGIYTSTDAGSTWSSLNTNLGTLQLVTIAASPTNDAHILAGAQDNSCDIYTNSTTWTYSASGDGAGTAFFSDTAFECNYVTLYPQISTDNGLSYSAVTTGLNTADTVQFYAPLAQDPSNPNIVYLGSDRVYQLTYPTLSWTDMSGIISTGSLTSIAVSKTNDNVLLAGDDKGIVQLSTDSGLIWNPVFNTTKQYNQAIAVTSVAIDPFNSSILYFALANTTSQRLFYSLDQGKTWNYFYLTGVPNVAVNVIKVNPVTDTLFIGTDRGLYYLNTTGSWNELGSGLPNAAIWDLTFTASNYLVVATHGRGAWLNYMTPQINLNVANGTSFQSGNSVMVGIKDPNGFSNVTYHWDQNTNSTASSPFNAVVPSSEGQHVLFVYAKDVAGNWVAKKYVFIADNTPPVVTLASLTNNTNIPAQSSVVLDLSDISPIQSVQYSWNGNANTTATVTSNKATVIAPSTTGQSVLQVFGKDSAGNIAETTFVFGIQASSSQPTTPVSSNPSTTTNPSTATSSSSTATTNKNITSSKLPGFEIVILVSTLSLVIIKRRRKQMKK